MISWLPPMVTMSSVVPLGAKFAHSAMTEYGIVPFEVLTLSW
jgi:hypothetical protein